MKKQLLCLLTIILCLNCYSQIRFEKGYYLDNSNQKTECLILNIDWKNNPTEFEYKLSENSKSEKTTLKTVKEFSIYNISKYIRSTVNIDRSSENSEDLSKERNPIFKEEELFLKVLVEGKSNLYEYTEGNLIRYFYTKENSKIEQLVFKSYTTTESEIVKNNQYRQQLWNDLKCPNINLSRIESIDYTKKDLVRFFTEYSECNNSSLTNFESKQKQDLFNLTLRPRLNSSSLSIENNNSFSNNKGADFGNNLGFGFGIEAEYILPFNKNKWAIAIEPLYQKFKSEKTTIASNVTGGIIIAKVDFSSIEVPVSVRHYFFLNNSSKIFANISYTFDFKLNSSLDFKRADNSNYSSLEIKARNFFSIGMGYKLKDKYSIEIRYQPSGGILEEYQNWNSDFKSVSIIFGYSFF